MQRNEETIRSFEFVLGRFCVGRPQRFSGLDDEEGVHPVAPGCEVRQPEGEQLAAGEELDSGRCRRGRQERRHASSRRSSLRSSERRSTPAG